MNLKSQNLISRESNTTVSCLKSKSPNMFLSSRLETVFPIELPNQTVMVKPNHGNFSGSHPSSTNQTVMKKLPLLQIWNRVFWEISGNLPSFCLDIRRVLAWSSRSPLVNRSRLAKIHPKIAFALAGFLKIVFVGNLPKVK